MAELHFWGILGGRNSGFKSDFYPDQILNSSKWMKDRSYDERTVIELLFRRSWFNQIDLLGKSCAVTWFRKSIQQNTHRPAFTAASIYVGQEFIQSAGQYQEQVFTGIESCIRKQDYTFNNQDLPDLPSLGLLPVANPYANGTKHSTRSFIILHNTGEECDLPTILKALPGLLHSNYTILLLKDVLSEGEIETLKNHIRLEDTDIHFVQGYQGYWKGLCEILKEKVLGCTNSDALNYNPNANVDNGSCIMPVLGCTDPKAMNYNSQANRDDGSCQYQVLGGTDPKALNYNQKAMQNDGSRVYSEKSGQSSPSVLKKMVPYVLTALSFGTMGYLANDLNLFVKDKSVAIKYKSATTSTGSATTAIGSDTTAIGSDTTATGSDTAATGSDTAATGSATTATGSDTTATGSATTSTGSATTATGSATTSTGSATTATGSDTTSTGSATTSTGSATTSTGSATTAAGSDTTATGSDNMNSIENGSVQLEENGQIGISRDTTSMGDGAPNVNENRDLPIESSPDEVPSDEESSTNESDQQ